jgi:hypothetical protein
LTPRDARTLIGRVQIAIDSKTSLPLRVEVFTRHSSRAAIHVAFSSISFSTPKASIFHFTPPKGAKVQPATVASLVGTGFGPSDAGKAAPEAAASPGTSAPPRVLGKGWTSVAVIGAGKLDPSTSKMLDRMSSRVPTGRLITTALASVLVADDGHIYVGAVTAADLQTVAATGRAL